MANDYRIHYSFTRVRNTQANVIVEGAHQTIGKNICTFKIQGICLNIEKPQEGILSSTMFAMRSKILITMQY